MKDIVTGWFRKSGYKGQIFEYPYYANSIAVKRNLDEFNENTEEGLKLLFVIDKLNEGLHLDEIQGCILLRTTVSNIIYYQQIGRVIDAGTTEKRIILDLVSNFNNLGSFNFKKELQEKIEERKEGNFKECSIDFEVDEFNVVDLIQDCIDVFSNIDNQIIGNNWTDEEIIILDECFPQIGAMEIVKRGLIPNHNYGAIKMKAYERSLSFRKVKTYEPNDEDDKVLIENYSLLGRKRILELLPHMTENQIKNRAKSLGLSFDNGKWTEKEYEILDKYYGILSIDDLMIKLPNRNKSAIISKASKRGLTSDRSIIWNREEDEKLELYPELGSKIFEQIPNKTKSQIQKRLRQRGIKKNRP